MHANWTRIMDKAKILFGCMVCFMVRYKYNSDERKRLSITYLWKASIILLTSCSDVSNVLETSHAMETGAHNRRSLNAVRT